MHDENDGEDEDPAETQPLFSMALQERYQKDGSGGQVDDFGCYDEKVNERLYGHPKDYQTDE